MKKLAFLIALCSIVKVSFAQDTTYHKLPDAKTNVPFFIINSRIITGNLASINPKDIKNVNILKDSAQIPANLKNMGQYGIINITTDQPIQTKTFAEIKNWLNITGDVKFAIDGFFVDDEKLLVATDSIHEIDILNGSPQQPGNIINIWTLTPNARKGKYPPYPNPPSSGATMIILR